MQCSRAGRGTRTARQAATVCRRAAQPPSLTRAVSTSRGTAPAAQTPALRRPAGLAAPPCAGGRGSTGRQWGTAGRPAKCAWLAHRVQVQSKHAQPQATEPPPPPPPLTLASGLAPRPPTPQTSLCRSRLVFGCTADPGADRPRCSTPAPAAAPKSLRASGRGSSMVAGASARAAGRGATQRPRHAPAAAGRALLILARPHPGAHPRTAPAPRCWRGSKTACSA